MMKILYIDQTGQLGGGELSLLDWLGVAHSNASVALFEDGPFRPLLEELGIPVEILPLASLSQVRRESSFSTILSTLPDLARLRTRLARASRNVDLLYANSQKAFLLAALAKRNGQPIVWHLRDILTGEHFSPLLRKVAVVAGNRFATLILVNSQATADAFVAAGGHRDKLRMAPDGVSSLLFDQVTPDSTIQLRQEICPGDHFLVGVFGRLATWKGQHILLEAIATIPDVHVCLVGDALFGEQAYAETLQTRATEPDLAGRVHFCGFRRDIPNLMRCMDVVVHSSISAEPLGRVIIEGMLAHKPVIATRAGGALEIVTDQETGLLVEPGSALEMSRAIQLLRGDQPLANKLAAAGRSHAESMFSLEAMVTRVNAVLEEFAPQNA
jgi:glycosyltransferase involved in cell wall biosynthesis